MPAILSRLADDVALRPGAGGLDSLLADRSPARGCAGGQ